MKGFPNSDTREKKYEYKKVSGIEVNIEYVLKNVQKYRGRTCKRRLEVLPPRMTDKLERRTCLVFEESNRHVVV